MNRIDQTEARCARVNRIFFPLYLLLCAGMALVYALRRDGYHLGISLGALAIPVALLLFYRLTGLKLVHQIDFLILAFTLIAYPLGSCLDFYARFPGYDKLMHMLSGAFVSVLCILLSMAMIYLLTKLIIEKNENAISMTKILGYENREIASLYLLSTTIVMLVIDVLTVAVSVWVMNFAWKEILMTYSGWFSFHMETISYVKMFAFVLIGYVIVMILDFQRIKKIPMDQALKNVE